MASSSRPGPGVDTSRALPSAGPNASLATSSSLPADTAVDMRRLHSSSSESANITSNRSSSYDTSASASPTASTSAGVPQTSEKLLGEQCSSRSHGASQQSIPEGSIPEGHQSSSFSGPHSEPRERALECCAQEPPSHPAPVPDEEDRLEPALEHISILAHLAVFSMIGVLIRYGMEILFGPRVLHVTDDIQALFLDVPPNMLGAFLMGIVGYVSKKDIAEYSQPLAIGLSTGLCGSITTFASWNQRMMSVLAYGLFARAIFGYILGTAVAYYAFLVGVDTAHGIRRLLDQHNERRRSQGKAEWAVTPEHYQRRWLSLGLSVMLALICWILASVAFALDASPPRLRKAALGCVVGPFGSWVRWFLSWRNGKGVGKQERWKWIPVGTLAANLLAVGIEGATSAVDAVYNTFWGSIVLGGLQLGFLGCLSTVSTLMQEVYVLQSAKASRWKGYVYLYVVTFLPAFLIGILTYCVPVWVCNVASNGYNKADPLDQAYVSQEFN